MSGQLQRMFASPRLIPALTVLAIVSLIMSTWVVVQFAQDQAEREKERIAADFDGCQQSNDLARHSIAVGNANEDLIAGILDAVFARSTTIAELREDLAPLFADHRDAIDAIEIVDCEQAARTSTTLPEDTP